MVESKGWYRRRLPHRDEPRLVQAITFHLADSLPLAELQSGGALPLDERTRRHRIQQDLDKGWGSCVLADPRAAAIVENALLFGDGERYVLLAWVVMPNHVHALIETVEGWPLPRILQGWKGFTARQINSVLGRQGSLWRREYWDRYVRDEAHLASAVQYVNNNPVKALLVEAPDEWRFGSARRVATVGATFHEPYSRCKEGG